MTESARHVINMANSIIGVSILSMPYCFKETGLMLGMLLLLFSGFITKKTCMFLIKSAIMSRRRSYELLAFQVFGVTGKLLMELCMILFLMGICISFHVVIGDLAPAMVAKYLDIQNTSSLRCTLLVGMVLLVILPLCLLRNLDSLASMSACSIGFYVFLNGVIFAAAFNRLLEGSWVVYAEMFRFENVFRVLPIMMLALACQSNVFEIYYSIPEPSVEKMKTVVSQAVNLSCALYIGVGFLGYVTFIDRDIGGNVILSFPYSNMTDGITIVFVMTLAISFPLILFPCRTSIHSLLYRRNIAQGSYDIALNFIPESRFKVITFSVLFISMLIGILLPSIEFVLGLLGSTMGMLIALIFPSIFFIKVYTKQSMDRLLAQGLLLIGIILMVTGTYLHLSGMQANQEPIVSSNLASQQVSESALRLPQEVSDVIKDAILRESDNANIDATGRKEPAIPEPPIQDKIGNVPNEQEIAVLNDNDASKDVKNSVPANVGKSSITKNNISKIDNSILLKNEFVAEGEKLLKLNEAQYLKNIENSQTGENGPEVIVNKPLPVIANLKKEETLHPDAIEKEEKENAEETLVAKQPLAQEIENKQEKILKEMQLQQNQQKQLIEEQKKILQELRNQKENIEKVEIVKNAASQIASSKQDKKSQISIAGDSSNLGYNKENRKEENIAIPISQDNLQKSGSMAITGEPLNKKHSRKKISLKRNTKKLSKNQPGGVKTNIDSEMQNFNDKKPQLKEEGVKLEENVGVNAVERPEENIGHKPLANDRPEKSINLLKSLIMQNRTMNAPNKLNSSHLSQSSILVSNGKAEELVHHDEERRRRDLSALSQPHYTSVLTSEKGRIANDVKLLEPEYDPNISKSASSANVSDHLILPNSVNQTVKSAVLSKMLDETAASKKDTHTLATKPILDVKSKPDFKKGLVIPELINSDRLSIEPVSKISVKEFNDVGKLLLENNLKSDFKKTEVNDVVYDTRHLLWSSRSNIKVNLGRRRKKRNKQYPDYWDEM